MTPALATLAGVAVFRGAIALAYRAGLLAMRPGGASGFLCDRCSYNDARYCSQPERPNARTCSEFKERGA